MQVENIRQYEKLIARIKRRILTALRITPIGNQITAINQITLGSGNTETHESKGFQRYLALSMFELSRSLNFSIPSFLKLLEFKFPNFQFFEFTSEQSLRLSNFRGSLFSSSLFGSPNCTILLNRILA